MLVLNYIRNVPEGEIYKYNVYDYVDKKSSKSYRFKPGVFPNTGDMKDPHLFYEFSEDDNGKRFINYAVLLDEWTGEFYEVAVPELEKDEEQFILQESGCY